MIARNLFVIACMYSAFFQMHAANHTGRPFDPKYVMNDYFLGGAIAIATPFEGLEYKIVGTNITIPTNEAVWLVNLLEGRRFPNKKHRVKGSVAEKLRTLKEGSNIILVPEPLATDFGKTDSQRVIDVLPYIIINRDGNFITIYVFNGMQGNKLVFNITAFENFMTTKEWYYHMRKDKTLGWVFGFQIDTVTADFTGWGNEKDKSSNDLLANAKRCRFCKPGPFNIYLSWGSETDLYFSHANDLVFAMATDVQKDHRGRDPVYKHNAYTLLRDHGVLRVSPLNVDDIEKIRKIVCQAKIVDFNCAALAAQ